MMVDLDKNKLVMWAVCEAIGSQHELIDKMEKIEGEGILQEIKFTVGGIELNFCNVIQAIGKNIDTMVEKQAEELVKEKFDNLMEIIEDTKENFIEKLNGGL